MEHTFSEAVQQTEWHVRRNVLVHAHSLRLPRTTRTAWPHAHPSAAPLSGTGAHGQRLCQWPDSPRRVATTLLPRFAAAAVVDAAVAAAVATGKKTCRQV